jgi:hypothetical protein
MNILIIGNGRNGSTRLLNTIKLIFLKCNMKYKVLWGSYFKKEIPFYIKNKICTVTHAHYMSENNYKLFDHILLPFRDIRNSTYSEFYHNKNIDQSNKNQIIEIMYDKIDKFNKFKEYGDLEIKFEDYGVETIKKILKQLKLELSIDEINNILLELENIHLGIKNNKNLIKRKNISNNNHNIYLNNNILKNIHTDKNIFNFLKQYNYI